jgi:hypothetical protein
MMPRADATPAEVVATGFHDHAENANDWFASNGNESHAMKKLTG